MRTFRLVLITRLVHEVFPLQGTNGTFLARFTTEIEETRTGTEEDLWEPYCSSFWCC